MTRKVRLKTIDFKEVIEPKVEKDLIFEVKHDGTPNGLRISGLIYLTPKLKLRATNAVNGDKILHYEKREKIEKGQVLKLKVKYQMGRGLASLKVF